MMDMREHHDWLHEQRSAMTAEKPVASAHATDRLRKEISGRKIPSEEFAAAALSAEQAERRIRRRGETRERTAMIQALGPLYRSGEETARESSPSADEEPMLHPDSDHSHRLRHGKRFLTL